MRTLKAVHDTIDYLRTEWMSNKMILRCRPAGYVLVYKVPPAPCIIIIIIVVCLSYHCPYQLSATESASSLDHLILSLFQLGLSVAHFLRIPSLGLSRRDIMPLGPHYYRYYYCFAMAN